MNAVELNRNDEDCEVWYASSAKVSEREIVAFLPTTFRERLYPSLHRKSVDAKRRNNPQKQYTHTGRYSSYISLGK
jgi:hypothetical protein